MKNYVYSSVFRQELNDYTELRKSQGFRDRDIGVLQRLDKYLISENAAGKALTPNIVDGFLAAYRPGHSASTMAKYASYCSGFAKYLQTIGFAAFTPEYIKPSSNYTPYIFSEEEMANIFDAADNLKTFGNTEKSNLTKVQFPMLLRLLYGCGLRLGEALSLRLADVDFNDGVLRVLNAKGNRDRLVPMEQTLSDILRRYCDLFLPGADSAHPLFAGKCKNDAEYRSITWANKCFKRVLNEVGIHIQSLTGSRRGVCLHCLRHTFAVHSFRRQDLAGVDNYRNTPSLSIYLGHVRLTGTEKYLHMTAENSEDIIATTNKYSEGMFPEVPQ
jgi:integrase